MKKDSCNIIIIFGATGDLTKRKLFPSLNAIFNSEKLPENFKIIGCGRKELEVDIFNQLHDEISKSSEYFKVDPSDNTDFLKLSAKINDLKSNHKAVNIIYYLSTPPRAYSPIIKNLIDNNLNKEDAGFRRIIIEKPFGNDLNSSNKLNNLLSSGFNESQIFRIDHYLGKETVQNILVSRFTNYIFNALWSREHISYVEITAAESIGIKGRGEYYDKSGAIKDMFQNHLLELLCLVSMEEPKIKSAESIRNEKINVLKSIRKINCKEDVIRGQYLGSETSYKKFKSYKENKGVDKNSKTETFFACKLFIDNKRWEEVPFFIRTGKRLPTKVTEIVVNFKKSINIFGDNNESNTLIFRLQPDEGMLVKFNLKKPGNKSEIINKNLEFHYKKLGDNIINNAYETLILDVFKGDTMLFSRSDFVEKAWKIVDPISEAIKSNKIKIYGYKAGTWGPKKCNDLFRNDNTWRYPCKNLVNDGEICEL
ncbi:MAG: glucose-6-phosphate dehydrogenase [Cytophagales bacterium]